MGATMGSLGAALSSTSKEYSIKPAEELPLSDKCHHYERKHEVPWDIQK